MNLKGNQRIQWDKDNNKNIRMVNNLILENLFVAIGIIALLMLIKIKVNNNIDK